METEHLLNIVTAAPIAAIVIYYIYTNSKGMQSLIQGQQKIIEHLVETLRLGSSKKKDSE